MEQIERSLLTITKQCRCGICNGSLENGQPVFIVVHRYAPWKWMVSNNVLAPGPNKAMTIICESCASHPETMGDVKTVIKSDTSGAYEMFPASELHVIKDNWIWFDESTDTGPDCICSFCAKPILETAMRIWDDDNHEARFHIDCFPKAEKSKATYQQMKMEAKQNPKLN